MWKSPPYFVTPNTFLEMRSEDSMTLRIDLKFGRTLLQILEDDPEAQDISANETENIHMFCDNKEKNSKKENSGIIANKVMIFADCN